MYEQLQDKIDQLLVGPLFESLKAVECRTPDFGTALAPSEEAFRAGVRVGHVRRTPEARYLVVAFGCRLELYVQLNVYRLVVVYRVPAHGALDSAALEPRFQRWAIGAADAGWRLGWRDAFSPTEQGLRDIEVYCYAALPINFLTDDRHQLYWITDVVQMTRSFLLEARRIGVPLPSLPEG